MLAADLKAEKSRTALTRVYVAATSIDAAKYRTRYSSNQKFIASVLSCPCRRGKKRSSASLRGLGTVLICKACNERL